MATIVDPQFPEFKATSVAPYRSAALDYGHLEAAASRQAMGRAEPCRASSENSDVGTGEHTGTIF